MIPTQMLKGILSGCVLAVIARQDAYGYEISQKMSEYGFGSISEGTVYPLLLRLEKGGLIAASHRESPSGPNRKYYSLTEAGQAELSAFLRSFGELSAAVRRLTEEMEAGK